MKTRLILCVDDEKAILDTLERQLTSALGGGCVIEMAEGAQEAWEIIDEYADEYELSLVISDWLMPYIKGDKFLVDLHKKYPEVNKIMLSGQADPAAIENAKTNANLDAFVSKPWDKDHLLNVITTAINGTQAGSHHAS
jgi:DNA-binding NtrC family response regulator